MKIFLSIFVSLMIVYLLLRPFLIPMHCLGKIGIRLLTGLVSLWVLNLISGFTGVPFPINLVTVCIAGFLGIPGVVALLLVRIFF